MGACPRRYYPLFILILLSCTPLPLNTVPAWLAPPRLIATTAAGQPVAAGDYLFWPDRRGGGAIYGYQRSQGRESMVAWLGLGAGAAYLASDGETVAWLDSRAEPQRIRAYHLPTRRASAIAIPAAQPMIADLAIDQGRLYYWDHAPDHRGIFAASLDGGGERRISELPRPTSRGRLAVAGGVLAWSEYRAQGPDMPPLASLYMARLSDGVERLVAQGEPWSGSLSGFALSGDHLVWSFALEQQVWLYSISSGARRVISAGEGLHPLHPLIKGDIAAWTVRDAQRRRQGIAVYDLATRELTPLVEAGDAYVEAQAIDEQANVIFTLDQRPALWQDLYLASGKSRSLRLDDAAERAPPPPERPPDPDRGQVQVQGKQFVVAGRRFTFDGAHLILPSQGINGGSFSAETLADPAAAAERREWLDRARQIGVRSIRIYLDMPGDAHVGTPPRPEQIYRFARDELAPRGMRLALVIHNSGRFDDPGGHKMAWLRALLDRFGGLPPRTASQGGGWHPPVDRTYLLAYINADNEINLHSHPADDAIPGSTDCRPDDPASPQIAEDCFDHPNPNKRRRYIRAALAWVALVRDTVRQHPSGRRVLITAGMSVDREKDVLGDGQSAVMNYFVHLRDASGRPLPALAELVDFIAPHSYTAQPYWEIVEPIERAEPFFARPILLEEFGYPTDPIAQPDPLRPAEYKETSLSIEMLGDGGLRLFANTQGLPAGEDLNKLCRYLPKLGKMGDSPKRCNPSAPYVVQLNLEAIFDLRQVAGGIAFMLADSNEKDDRSKDCYAADAQQQLSKNLFSGLFATNNSYRCGGTVNIGRGQIKNTGYRVCVAYRTGNPQLGDYRRRVPECEIDRPGVP